MSSSDSLDNLSGFDKLKPYDLELNREDEDVSSSTMQRKEAEKERKRNLDLCLCGKCNAMSTMLIACAVVRKMKTWMKFLMVTFFISDYVI